MSLMNVQLEEVLPPLYEQQQNEQKIAYTRFYLTSQDLEWYALEYSALQRLFYGLVMRARGKKEYGYFTLRELESLGSEYQQRVRKDHLFEPTCLNELAL